MAGFIDPDSEFAVLEAGGDVGVRARIDVRIHAEADRGRTAHSLRDGGEHRKLGRRFDVEAEDIRAEPLLHFRFGLADAGKDNPCWIASRGDHTRELAAGHDIEAAAEPREDIEHAEVAVRFHCVAHKMRQRAERRIEPAPFGFERRARIDKARRAESLGERRQRHAFGVKGAVDVRKRTRCRAV